MTSFKDSPEREELKYYCPQCDSYYDMAGKNFLCNCGGFFQLNKKSSDLTTELSLGEVKTPVYHHKHQGYQVAFKLDYYQPTGSFKDRGARLMLGLLKEQGVKEIIEDSSGNAGAAIAAYAAAADIDCEIFLPEDTSSSKVRQISAYGAKIRPIAGDRQKVMQRVQREAKKKVYASHIYNPLFIAGVSSLAEEILADFGEPGTLFLPAGNGSLLLGVAEGLEERGVNTKIIAVQSKKCAPLYRLFKQKALDISKLTTDTVASGIAIPAPPRLTQMKEVVEKFQGEVVVVDEQEIIAAREYLGREGIYIESTAAVAWAGMKKFCQQNNSIPEPVVIPLTGSGLKE